MKPILIALLASMTAVGASSVAANDDADAQCSCVRVGKRTICKRPCVISADADTIAALKRFPDLEEEMGVMVINNGKRNHEVAFYVPNEGR